MSRPITLGCGLALAVACARPAPVSTNGERRDVPVDPARAIADAFRSHRFVALGEGEHWNEQSHAFRVSLVWHPDLAARAFDDIVVEFGNSRYQSLMDRYVGGATVPDDSLRLVWQNTTSPNEIWDRPIYAAFFRAVRDANAQRGPGRQLRVILADPPIDWDRVRTKEAILQWLGVRDSVAAAIVQREVVDRRRRALLLFGDGHLWRRPDAEPTLVTLLERTGERVFVITTPTTTPLAAFNPDVAAWKIPALASIRGTRLGNMSFARFYRFPDMQAAPWDATRVSDVVDAVLYLGSPETITLSKLPPQLCNDSSYMHMRIGRLTLVPWGPGEIQRIRRHCGLG